MVCQVMLPPEIDSYRVGWVIKDHAKYFEQTITLRPKEAKFLAAMAEAAGIPRPPALSGEEAKTFDLLQDFAPENTQRRAPADPVTENAARLVRIRQTLRDEYNRRTHEGGEASEQPKTSAAADIYVNKRAGFSVDKERAAQIWD